MEAADLVEAINTGAIKGRQNVWISEFAFQHSSLTNMSEVFMNQFWHQPAIVNAKIHKAGLSFSKQNNRRSVAVHVRRGDLPRNHFRLLPDSWFFDKIALIQKRFPDADVHIFSDTSTWGGRQAAW